MQKDGFEFDFETQRFLVNRWETGVGKRVLTEIVDGIKNGVELRAILDRYESVLHALGAATNPNTQGYHENFYVYRNPGP